MDLDEFFEQQPPLLTYAQAGYLLGVHAKTIRDWADEGRLKKVSLGPQTLRVTTHSVQALVLAHMEPDGVDAT